MKILALTNLYPPHHAGTYDFRCQNMVEALRLRGHELLVLTSTQGMKSEQRDAQVERRLKLNGAFEAPHVTNYPAMKALETHNNQVLMETIERFQPDVIQVFSLRGISKSLIFTLRNYKLPFVFDVTDFWISADIREDSWLKYWNTPSLPFLEQSTRTALEMSGERGRLDDVAPTRMMKGYERLPHVYGGPRDLSQVEPNSIPAFRFDRIYFCSHALKSLTQNAGFRVGHGEVFYPGIKTELYVSEIKPQSAPISKFLIVSKLVNESGVMTALQAIRQCCAAKMKLSLTIHGRGDSNYIASLKSLVVREELPVEFLNVSNLVNDLPAVYKRHDAFLYTAEWNEPFSTTVLEAMAAGLPVIGASSGGAQEFLRHAETALVYTPGNADELAARIYELQMSPAMRCQIAEAGQTEVLSKCNESTITDQIENYLNVSQEIWAHSAT